MRFTTDGATGIVVAAYAVKMLVQLPDGSYRTARVEDVDRVRG